LDDVGNIRKTVDQSFRKHTDSCVIILL
jgi:hypothetical protein